MICCESVEQTFLSVSDECIHSSESSTRCIHRVEADKNVCPTRSKPKCARNERKPAALYFARSRARGGGAKLVGMNRIILLVVVIVLLLLVLPTWPYSSGWGYYPSGGLGLILLIIVLALLFGKGSAPP
jgi:hypothetical protein